MEELAELADGPTGRGEVTRARCLLACYICVTRSVLLTVAERTRTNWRCRCLSDSLLAYRLKIPQAKDRALHYTPVYLAMYVAVDNVANYVVHEFFRNSVAQLHNTSLAPRLKPYPDPYVSSPDPNNPFLRSILLLLNIGLDTSVVSSLQVFPYFFSSSCAALPAYHILHLIVLQKFGWESKL